MSIFKQNLHAVLKQEGTLHEVWYEDYYDEEFAVLTQLRKPSSTHSRFSLTGEIIHHETSHTTLRIVSFQPPPGLGFMTNKQRLSGYSGGNLKPLCTVWSNVDIFLDLPGSASRRPGRNVISKLPIRRVRNYSDSM